MQNKGIMVSIICTTFNHERYIKSCMDGLLMQRTNFNYEIIIHDDCSTDGTADIIKRYAAKNPDNIKTILQTENQYSKGVNIVGDLMMPQAQGKYIAFCEGDDAWNDETKLSSQVDFLEKHHEYIACVHNTFFHRCDKYCQDFPMFVYDEDKDLEFKDILKWNAFGYQYSSLLVRKEYYTDPPFGYGEYPMALYLSLNGKIRFLAKTMSVYRFRSSQYATRANIFSKRAMINETEGIIEVFKKIKGYIKDDRKKELVENKISALSLGLESLKNMTDEQYNKGMRKQERMLDMKLYVRSHFKRLYKIIINRK